MEIERGKAAAVSMRAQLEVIQPMPSHSQRVLYQLHADGTTMGNRQLVLLQTHAEYLVEVSGEPSNASAWVTGTAMMGSGAKDALRRVEAVLSSLEEHSFEHPHV